jgi:hypothetical protein
MNAERKLRRIIKEEIKSVVAELTRKDLKPDKDYRKYDKAFVNFIIAHRDALMDNAQDSAEAVLKYVKANKKDTQVSDKYIDDFYENLKSEPNAVERMRYIYNTELLGSGMGAPKGIRMRRR